MQSRCSPDAVRRSGSASGLTVSSEMQSRRSPTQSRRSRRSERRQQGGVLEQVAQVGQEPGGVGAVDDAVVERD